MESEIPNASVQDNEIPSNLIEIPSAREFGIDYEVIEKLLKIRRVLHSGENTCGLTVTGNPLQEWNVLTEQQSNRAGDVFRKLSQTCQQSREPDI